MNANRIAIEISKLSKIPLHQLYSRSRVGRVAWWRQIGMALHRQAGLTQVEVAKLWRRKRYGTVWHAQRAVRNAIETDPKRAKEWQTIKSRLGMN